MILKTIFLIVAVSILAVAPSRAASALGLDTAEWTNPSAEVVAQVEAMEAAIAAAARGESPQATLQQAIDKIRELADKGNDKDAIFAIGFLTQQSQQPNALAQAMSYYKRAADLGQLQAMNNYGFLLAGSTQEVEKAQEGIAFIKKAADGGLNAARRNMASIYLNGLGGEERNPEAARQLLEKAALDGDGQAQFELSQFYLELGGSELVDDDKAWEWLNKAADSGNPSALATLGSVLFDGKTFGARKIDADPAKAVEKFQTLADQGVPAGLRTMGELHIGGLGGVEKNFSKALEYFSRAAQGNDPTAQVILAGYYDQGVDFDPQDGKIDVAPNVAVALDLYRLAARNEVPFALFKVGTFYEEGRAVDRDMQKAFIHYLQSAGGGFAPAMHRAGNCYLNGLGTPRDPIAAAGWFNRAASLGLPEGLLSLGVMAETGQLPVAAGSTPAQIAAETYRQILQNLQVADQTRFEALLRLGGLNFRGVLVAPGAQPSPNFVEAYKHFKQAVDLFPDNPMAANFVKEAADKLTPEQIQKADAEVTEALAARKAALEQAATAAGANAAPGNAAPQPRAEPAGGDAPKAKGEEAAEPAKGKGEASAGEGGEKKSGRRLPFLGR